MFRKTSLKLTSFDCAGVYNKDFETITYDPSKMQILGKITSVTKLL